MKIEKRGGMVTLLSIAWLGNLMDTVATVCLHSVYGYMEGNPVMAWLLQWPWLFIFIKLAAMTAVALRLWCERVSRYARAAAWVAAAIYGAVALYYVQFFLFFR